MINNSTIYESFVLPSRGLIYDTQINPNITLRSMTTLEEMKRLSPTDMPYKVMSDIIEDCMKEPPQIHVYDMCLGDYQFLLHKLRIVTYGPDYKMTVRCNKCNQVTNVTANLDDLALSEWDDSMTSEQIITLPRTNKEIQLRFQTPRDLDQIAFKAKEMRRKSKQNIDYSLMYTLESLIKKVDGSVLSSIALDEFVKNLPNRDANYLLNKATELNRKIGLDTNIPVQCAECGAKMMVPFRITSEFFGPTI